MRDGLRLHGARARVLRRRLRLSHNDGPHARTDARAHTSASDARADAGAHADTDALCVR